MAKKPTRQTTRINGARVVITTSASGKVTVKPANVLEIDLQTEAVRRIRAMPGYAARVEDLGTNGFTIAADQNGSGYRSMKAAAKFKAAGMASGEPDVRVYFSGGRLMALEFKAEKGKLTASQNVRFALLRSLGFVIEVVEASTVDEAGDKAVELVRGWLATNDNEQAKEKCALAK